jgi:hypothetical protein
VHDLRDHVAHSWLLRHQGSAGERAKNEASVSLVTSRYPGTNSDLVVVVMAAPPGTAGSRSPGTTRIIDPQSVVGTTEPALLDTSLSGRAAGTVACRAVNASY